MPTIERIKQTIESCPKGRERALLNMPDFFRFDTIEGSSAF
jgi:hypothetical protein